MCDMRPSLPVLPRALDGPAVVSAVAAAPPRRAPGRRVVRPRPRKTKVPLFFDAALSFCCRLSISRVAPWSTDISWSSVSAGAQKLANKAESRIWPRLST